MKIEQANKLINKHENEDIPKINSQLEQIKTYNKFKLVNDYNESAKTGTDNTSAFNSIVSSMLTNIKNNGIYKTDNTLVIPNGAYYFNGTITMSPIIKLKPIGTVKFIYGGTGEFFKIKQQNEPVDIKEMWNRGSIVDGSNGAIILTTKNNDKVGSGLILGDTVTGTGNICRYSLNDIGITGFNNGLVLNPKNNYIGSFNKVHIELNNNNIVTNEGTVVNSGENFNFNSCVIAGAKNHIQIKDDGNFDLNFNCCSFDFGTEALLKYENTFKYTNSINFNMCHMEENELIVNNLANDSLSTYTPPRIEIKNCRIIKSFKTMFKGSKISLSIDDLTIKNLNSRPTDIADTFLCENYEKQILRVGKVYLQNNNNSSGFYITDNISNVTRYYEKNVGNSIIGSTLSSHKLNSQTNIKVAEVITDSSLSYRKDKCLKIEKNTGTNADTLIDFEIEDIDIEYGKTLVFGFIWKTSDTTVGVNPKVKLFKEDGTAVQNIDMGYWNWEGTGGAWKSSPFKYKLDIVDYRAKKCNINFRISNFNLVYLDSIIINILD